MSDSGKESGNHNEITQSRNTGYSVNYLKNINILFWLVEQIQLLYLMF